ncbi:hypothetical protein GUY44_17515 [Pimelobacter simplex]|uniref:Universal stress protein n=1 Tax=Nocardioides simplex TaxID=2045 RepID=A0A0A1DRQ8_NOCSI|nr:hypothetical protein [Pimelobacter simplex]AIY20101.2 hypothetical protein KR76_21645 [Pimelobacter simplex]KAB2812047.1 hypothetical protein F9L07_09480 [Pimelobacter simplex]MCG8152290.1 hypothetical protein [Pimelobacter simplex]SFM30061.1 hypothetical protein SAMN05421671_1015 [Pimelobacter simplex]GEB14405.1 hypothetical protein NSI01_27200 [Pimelobacter simplex]
MTSEPAPREEPYDVVLLIEKALTPADAAQVRSLHVELDDDPTIEVIYHVLLPMADAAAAVEASLGVIGGADLIAPPITPSPDEIDALREEYREQADRELAATREEMLATGAHLGSAVVVTEAPVDALIAKVKEVDGRESIILTRPHLVAEFFHVDWTSRARRKLGVPVLHLLEHETA